LPCLALPLLHNTHSLCLSSFLPFPSKFIHNAARAGHIEDVVVDAAARGRGLGRVVVTLLRDLALRLRCYKVMLDCAEANAPFYEKCGFRRGELSMARYF
jgi:glucosamine-phosphate N-acetyltransferase